jgi:hypothetical protein
MSEALKSRIGIEKRLEPLLQLAASSKPTFGWRKKRRSPEIVKES